jgi:hypothetical protein
VLTVATGFRLPLLEPLCFTLEAVAAVQLVLAILPVAMEAVEMALVFLAEITEDKQIPVVAAAVVRDLIHIFLLQQALLVDLELL